jgi:hypothetical protein
MSSLYVCNFCFLTLSFFICNQTTKCVTSHLLETQCLIENITNFPPFMKQCFSLLQVQEHATLHILSQINTAYTHPVTFIPLTYQLVLPRALCLSFFSPFDLFLCVISSKLAGQMYDKLYFLHLSI